MGLLDSMSKRRLAAVPLAGRCGDAGMKASLSIGRVNVCLRVVKHECTPLVALDATMNCTSQ